jgi:FKBP-type peptidyl-prolyl cis-trans isomerase FkpA
MNRETLSALLLGAALVAAGCQAKKDGASASPSPAAAQGSGVSDDEKALLALGAAMGEQARTTVTPLMLTPAELETFKKGFSTGLAGQKAEYGLQEFGSKLQARAEKNAPLIMAAEKQKGTEFANKAAQEPGAQKTASGLVYKQVAVGTGATPKVTDVVQVHYHGTTVDGKVFDSSVQRGQPAQFPLNGVIPCWTEGVAKMKVGEKARLVCPSDIAYGDQGRPPAIPPGATLVFDVELLAIQDKAAAARAPQGR